MKLTDTRTPEQAEAHRLAEAAKYDALLAEVEQHRGALADMRDWCEGVGFPTAQRARAVAVVRRVEQRFAGGVAAFLTGY